MNQNQEQFTPEEQIKNEIELMKLKLEVEHGAIIHTSAEFGVSPELELAWFNHINDYERLCKEAGYTTVYDYVKSPAYKNITELSPEEVTPALNQLLATMHQQGVALTYIEDEYTSDTIYRFITEELFLQQICRYRGPEGNSMAMFCYEEFHPNHRHDLDNAAQEWLESIFGEAEWFPKWINHSHTENVTLNHQYLSEKTYSDRIVAFKISSPSFLFLKKEITSVEFDLEIQKATVKGTVQTNTESIPFTLHFQYDYFIWLITHVEMKLL